MSRSGRIAGLLESALAGLLVVFAAWLLFHLLLYPFGRDQATFSTVAREMLAGDTLYRDVTDIKTPAIYFVYALAHAVLGPGQTAVRVLEALAVASMLLPFLALSVRHAGSRLAGLIAWAIAVFAHVRLEYWNTAQAESFGAVALVWAFGLVDPLRDGGGRRTRLRWLAAGMLFSAAGLLKPVMGIVAIVPLALLVGRDRRAALPLGALLVLGAAAPVALTLIYFAANGALADLQRLLLVTLPRYAGLHLRPEWMVGLGYEVVRQFLANYSPYFLLGLALLLALPFEAPRGREGALLFGAVAALLLLGVAAQAKFFAYHYGSALPFGSLLSGWGIRAAWRRLRPRAGWLAAFLALLVVLHDVDSPLAGVMARFWKRCDARIEALRSPERRDALHDELYSSTDMDRRAVREVSAWIAESTRPDATLLLWSMEPLIHVLSGRRPATRYVHDAEPRLAGPRSAEVQALLRELQAAPPDVVVIQYGDRFPEILGNSDDSATAFGKFDTLREWLVAHYEPTKSFERFQVLELRRPG
jgi:hypothetical protein